MRMPGKIIFHIQQIAPSDAPATKSATQLLKTTQKYCACHRKLLSTTYDDTWECHNVPHLPCKTTIETVWEIVHLRTRRRHNWEWRQDMISCEASSILRLPGSFLMKSKIFDLKTRKWIFRAPHPLIFITSHKMPFLPRNLHVSTWRSPDNAIRKEKIRNTIRPKCCACHAKCCVCKCNSCAEDDANELRLSHKSTLRHVIKQNCSTQT